MRIERRDFLKGVPAGVAGLAVWNELAEARESFAESLTELEGWQKSPKTFARLRKEYSLSPEVVL